MYPFKNPDSEIDAETLQTLARQATTASRSELAQSIVALFDSPAAELGPDARAMAYDILHSIVRDIEMAARQEIARRLAERSDAPRDLIRFLANDTIEVAYPILVKSEVLDDTDLVEIIRARTLEHSLAIASRPVLSDAVTDALVMTDAEDVIVTVLRNPGSTVSPGMMIRLVERARKSRAIREPVLMRKEMNPELALRMFLLVSSILREYILRNFSFDQKTINQLCEQIMLEEIEHFATKGKIAGDFSKKLPTLIKEKGKLTPEMLVLALREGDVTTFVNMYGRMTDIKRHIVDRFLFDPTGRGLAVACKGISASKIIFASLFSLAQKMRGEVTGTIKQRLGVAADFYDMLPQKEAVDVLGEWRKGMDYMGSIRSLNERILARRH
ncbi:MAG: DUF2336 domain-containing protein [Rhodospirillales bacterium]|nr:DUF2336 domain-containing protein [Rhodospirillales bacterium]